MGLLLGCFIQSRKCMSLKFTGELCVMTMKNDAQFEEELTCQLKIDMRNFDKFWPKHSKNSTNYTFMGCFWQKYMMFELKKVQMSYFWLHWRLMQNLKKNWLVLSKMTWRIWQIFVHSPKNINFILEIKKAELNQNQNSKQPDWPDAVWKLYFTFEINE